MINNAERKGYESVAKMTGLELAKIEADEMHPLHHYACEEIDTRNASAGRRHALDAFDEQDAWDRSFTESQERLHFDHTLNYRETESQRWERAFENDGQSFEDDEFVAAAGFVDPEQYEPERFVDMYDHAYA